jgi:DNA-binding PadR family transcriptional regulator
MAFDAGDSISFMESKIIQLAKGQYDHGIHGGTFTPGYVRKETGYEYRAIDPALDLLVTHNLLEMSRTTTFRNGASVEIDLFRITEKGLQTFEKLKAGIIRVEREPSARPFESKPQGKSESKERRDQSPGLAQSVKGMEVSLTTIRERVAELHVKVDRMLTGTAQQPTDKLQGVQERFEDSQEKPPRSTGKRLPSPEKQRHHVLAVEALRELLKTGKGVLSSDIERMYGHRCKELGLQPKPHQLFALLLKRMAANGHVSLKLTGCRELGIKGHGSRIVVDLTPEGEEFLAKNGNPEGTIAASTGLGNKPHGNIDGLLTPTQTGLEVQKPVAPPKTRRQMTPSASFVLRHVLLLESVKELSKDRKYILADDVKNLYVRKCEEKGVTTRGIGQFGVFLKRFKADGLLTVKRVGCKTIGIEGRGSRLVIEMTPEGEKFIAENGKIFRIDGDSQQGT